MAKATKTSKKSSSSREPVMVEWIAGALGGLMVIGAIAYLLYAEASGDATAPQVEFTVHKTEQQADGYVVEFEAKNTSSFSAAKFKIKGELRSGDQVIETAETELDYLPAYSSRAAGLYFQHDPSQSTLSIAPVAYSDP
jgi:uncharacterized protein (TIGR02588 family)